MPNTLYVVATPIGNLEDLSPRAARVLREVGVIAAEDTRVLRRLEAGGWRRLHPNPLPEGDGNGPNRRAEGEGVDGEAKGKGQGAKGEKGPRRPRVVSFNEHNRDRRIPEILAALGDGDVALVSDAGTPGISDPGVELVAAARAAGFRVEAVPGPSAVTTALSVAGLRARSWRFVGFLPRRAGELRRLLNPHPLTPSPIGGRGGTARGETIVAFEAPSRLRKSLAAVAEVLPERRIAVCRELTKAHEEVFVGTAAEALAHFGEPRGEIVIVIEGEAPARKREAGGEKREPATGEGKKEDSNLASGLVSEVALMRSVGLTRAQAAGLLKARYGVSRRRAYELWLAEARGGTGLRGG